MNAARRSFRLVPQKEGQGELHTTEFAVVDLETTGGSAEDEKITEMAACVTQDGKIVRTFEHLVNPERPIPPFVRHLTGITNEMVADQPTIAEVLPEFLDIVGKAIIVAHHADFDTGFLRKAARTALNRELPNGVVCTRRLGQQLLPWLPSHSLSTIADFFGIGIKNRHRAMGDALATTAIMNIYLRYLGHRGINELKQLYQLERGKLSLS